MLRCSTSLWSVDLSNLERDVRRVEPYSDRFHFDVIDGRYRPSLLFFPDLVRAVRPHTALPFEVHLMCVDPLAWIRPFAEAGADIIICQYETLSRPRAVIDAVEQAGLGLGIALALDAPVDVLEPYWAELDLVAIIGTEIGVKGVDFDERALAKVRAARNRISASGLTAEIQVDGGIRRHTVPLIHAAGADSIVPGSLMFNHDPSELRKWLDSL